MSCMCVFLLSVDGVCRITMPAELIISDNVMVIRRGSEYMLSLQRIKVKVIKLQRRILRISLEQERRTINVGIVVSVAMEPKVLDLLQRAAKPADSIPLWSKIGRRWWIPCRLSMLPDPTF
uniref:Secreted protein n=1 Tax=Panagrellus redivivus TaxID=6233 RepID=A0A7E5A1X9_PANRE